MDRRTFALIAGYMHACMRDSAHDKEHVYRVLNNAIEIAAGEGSVDMDVLITAALLHDISRPEQLVDPRIDHAVHGAEKAHAFLLECGFPEPFSQHVRDCICTHRYRRSEPPATVEARILFDADKLDVCGAIGIARTLQYSGESGRPIYTRDEAGRISDGTGDTADSFFREYKFKLERICDHFLTDKGRELAQIRHAAVIAYYEALLAEVRQSDRRDALDDLLTDT